MAGFISTDHIDYLQRLDMAPVPLPRQPGIDKGPSLRRLARVRGVGWSTKGRHAAPLAPEQPTAMTSGDLIVGLYGYKIPLAYWVHATPQSVSLHLGTWAEDRLADAQQDIVGTALRGLYPVVDMEPAGAPGFDPARAGLTRAGLVLGIPSAKPPILGDQTAPWDRVIRALQGSTWAALVLAQPITEDTCSHLRSTVLNEMRATGAAQQSEGAPSPLAGLYGQLLEAHLNSLSHGLGVGAWRTAVYLLGDETSYYRLASIWRGIFSGPWSQVEPVRVWDHQPVLQWAASWALPDVTPERGPGLYQHLFHYQTLLTSDEVSTYIHLPEVEKPGFQIRAVVDFDVEPPAAAGDRAITLGTVIHQTRATTLPYAVSIPALQRHVLVAGITGSGKTNTVFHLLRALWQRRVPFLVLEPAKTEYRALLAQADLRDHLQVFSVGDEAIAPFRLNPFEVEPGVPVATHIDLLKSVFNASFGMWTPLPQILERCLHAVYADFGWDPVRDRNDRLAPNAPESIRAAAYPTLTDLYEKAAEVVDELGYDSKVASDLKAALLTRLNSLRIGGKGATLDTKLSVPIAALLDAPTVIELEAVGDDDEKAFLMGLILVRLYEHRRAHGAVEGTQLKHVVVVEEAHRLLTSVPPSADPERANVKGKAVETFVNMLSEVRAYGEGFVVAEQIPTKLAPEVLKNTNLKLVHRMVAGDDREMLRQTMAMEQEQADMLATLGVGQAAAFAEGDDRPVLIQVPYAKIEGAAEMANKSTADRLVTARMASVLQAPLMMPAYALFDFYPEASAALRSVFDDAREMIDRREVQDRVASTILGLAVNPDQSLRQLGALLTLFRTEMPQRSATADGLRCALFHAVRWYTTRFGRLYNWPYAVLGALQRGAAMVVVRVSPSLLGAVQPDPNAIGQVLRRFRDNYLAACLRDYEPFETCGVVCPSGACLYRYHARRLLTDPRLVRVFDAELQQAAEERRWDGRDGLETIAAQIVGEGSPADAQRSASLCFGVQRIAGHPELLASARTQAITALLGVW